MQAEMQQFAAELSKWAAELQIPCPFLSSVIMCRSRRQNLTSNFMVKVVYKSLINQKCELCQTSWCTSVCPLFATRNCTHPHASFVCPLFQEIAMMMVNKLSQISLNLKLPATPLSLSLSLFVAQQCMKEFQTKPSCDCAQENKWWDETCCCKSGLRIKKQLEDPPQARMTNSSSSSSSWLKQSWFSC
jgi:hypothetical protein